MEKKYELTDETIEVDGHILHKIKALRNLGFINKGDLGGFIEKEKNLSHTGDCWVFNNAKVYGNSIVKDNACIYDNAIIKDSYINNSINIYQNAIIVNCYLFGASLIGGNISNGVYTLPDIILNKFTVIKDENDFIIFKNWWSSGRFFIWTRSNNMWSVGCFYGTGKQLIAKAYKDSELSGREYKRIVDYVESILKDEKQNIFKTIFKRIMNILK